MLHTSAFVQEIKSDPSNPGHYLILADYLEERGRGKAAAALRRMVADPTRLLLMLVQPRCRNVADQLSRANGSRRVGTIYMDDVIHAIKKASEKGYCWTAGAVVANAYGYPAVRTCCVAARASDGTIRVGIAQGNAQKGSSPITPVCGAGIRRGSHHLADNLRAWADA